MKVAIAILVLITASSCSPFQLEVSPVTVTHKISLEELSQYFKEICETEFERSGLPKSEQEEFVKTCTDNHVLNFLNVLGSNDDA